MRKYNVAILGATGAVGAEFLRLIEERNFPFAELKLLASKRSAGQVIKFMGKDYVVEEATENSFEGVEIALSQVVPSVRLCADCGKGRCGSN